MGRRSIIGHNVEIGSGSYITNSCIGDDCKIGENVVIKDCTVAMGSIIENNSKLTGAIIGPQVTILENSTIVPYSVIGESIKLAVSDSQLIPVIISDIKKVIYNKKLVYLQDFKEKISLLPQWRNYSNKPLVNIILICLKKINLYSF